MFAGFLMTPTGVEPTPAINVVVYGFTPKIKAIRPDDRQRMSEGQCNIRTGKRVFVTVGSTRFPELVEAVLSEDTLNALIALGYTSILFQWGKGGPVDRIAPAKITVDHFEYAPSLDYFMEEADMIISHAGSSAVLSLILGSGSLLEALHLKKLLIVVPNTALMDNHQIEVAKALCDQGHLIQTTVRYVNAEESNVKRVGENTWFAQRPRSAASSFSRFRKREIRSHTRRGVGINLTWPI
jgi:beta-1,4-N-acetylglucosaminyltransferase